MDELLAKATRDYPPGTTFESIYSGHTFTILGKMYKSFDNIKCDNNGETPYIYKDGKWSKIISLPHSKVYELW